jgi:hypothetical protein
LLRSNSHSLLSPENPAPNRLGLFLRTSFKAALSIADKAITYGDWYHLEALLV